MNLPYDGFDVDIPPAVALCPYCGGNLSAHANAWEESDTGGYYDVTEIELSCENEFDETDEEGEDVDHIDHTSLPYVYWMPVQMLVIRWMNTSEAKQAFAYRESTVKC